MTETSPTLFLTGQTAAQLADKFESTPELREMWQHFLLLAEHNPVWFSSYNVLAYLVTGDDAFAPAARQAFVDFTASKDDGLLSDEAQFHTHTSSAHIARVAITYDWIADSDLLTAAEHDAFRQAVIDFVNLTAMQQLQGRARAFDNQIFANAFAAAVVGHVFGVRRGNDPCARRILAVGQEWLLDQYQRLPHTLYSLEGSTYHQLVVIPLLTLGGVFLEEVAQLPIYEQGVPPSSCPLRDWLIADMNFVGPGGLMPGWDAYGVFHNAVKAPLAYLARRERDPAPLALCRATDTWYKFAHCAWEFDDRVWTLIWWPEDLPVASTFDFRNWLVPETAGAVQDGDAQIRLFQYWDECPGIPHCGRPNVNPNAIQLDFAGLPLLLDGAHALPEEYLMLQRAAIMGYLTPSVIDAIIQQWRLSNDEDTRWRMAKRCLAGSIGESNSLVIDGENWYVPLAPCQGKGLDLSATSPLRVIRSDAKDYYTDRYDVQQLRRTSALVRGRYVVVCDDFATATPHQWSWQAFTWPGAKQDGDAISVDAGGQVKLSIHPGAPGAFELTAIDGFPKYPCEQSTRVVFHRDGRQTQGRLPICLHPQSILNLVQDVSDGWRLNGDEASAIDLCRFYLTDRSRTGDTHRFARQVTLSADEISNGCVLTARFVNGSVSLVVNGHQVEPKFSQTSHEIENQTLAFSAAYDLSGLLVVGENRFELSATNFHGESVKGPLQLCAKQSASPLSFKVHNDHEFQVTVDGESDELLLDNSGVRDWQEGRTDAVHALQGANLLALGLVTVADFPKQGLRVRANQAVDLAVAAARLEVGELPASAALTVSAPGLLVQINARQVIQISGYSRNGHTLVLPLPEPHPVFVNGEGIGVHGGARGRELSIVLPEPVAIEVTSSVSETEVYAWGDAPPENLAECLEAAFASDEWRVQMAAAEVAGQYQVSACVESMVVLVAAEDAERPHPKLTRSWTYSKMNKALENKADKTPDPDIDRVAGTKRYRLKRALVAALGRIGDARAIPCLERALTEDLDFFPAMSQVPIALARLDSKGSVPILETMRAYAEVNVQRHVMLSLDYLTGAIDRATFEQRANPA